MAAVCVNDINLAAVVGSHAESAGSTSDGTQCVGTSPTAVPEIKGRASRIERMVHGNCPTTELPHIGYHLSVHPSAPRHPVTLVTQPERRPHEVHFFSQALVLDSDDGAATRTRVLVCGVRTAT